MTTPMRIKDRLFDLAWPVSYASYLYWVVKLRIKDLPGPLTLNFGCGQDRSRRVPGMLNLDGNPLCRPDMYLDFRRRLPFRNQTVSLIFSCHVLEHFYIYEVESILREWHRVLIPGGGARIVVPSLENAVDFYIRKDFQRNIAPSEDFSSVPAYAGRSTGRCFVGLMLDWDQHKCMFDFGFMAECLEDAGFRDVQQREYLDSQWFQREELARLEHSPGYSIYIEATK